MATEIIEAYNNLLSQFFCTLKEASADTSKREYMTESNIPVVNLDKFKDGFVKNMALTSVPKSCDALFLADKKTMFMMEFKNGIIEVKKNYEIKVKIFESLLMLLKVFSKTIEFSRNNWVFILVYNECVEHGEDQFDDVKDIGIEKIENALFDLAKEHKIRFGLYHFQKLYFKEVYTYSKSEFESEFIAKYSTELV